VTGDGAEGDQVSPFLGHHGRAGRDPGEVHGDLGHLGEGPAHAVGVQHRYAHPGRPGDGDQAVGAADLGGHQRRDLAAGHELQVLAEPVALIPAEDLLDAHRGRADHPAGHDQLVVREFVQVDQGYRAVVLGCLQRLHHADVGVAATAGAEHGAAARQCTQ
jgi:hypothetical protein